MEFEHLPDEIWINIFQYIPFEDRILHIRCCCKRFYHLCEDFTLQRNINFEGCFNMPDKTCKSTLRKAKKCAKNLSFQNCSWFSNRLFMTFPIPANLLSLNLLGCDINSGQLKRILLNATSLTSLMITMTHYEITALTSSTSIPKHKLKVLHIDCIVYDKEDRTDSGLFSFSVIKLLISNCCDEAFKSVSVFLNLPSVFSPHQWICPVSKYSVASKFSSTSSYSANHRDVIFLRYRDELHRKSCDVSEVMVKSLKWLFISLSPDIGFGPSHSHRDLLIKSLPSLKSLIISLPGEHAPAYCDKITSELIDQLECTKLIQLSVKFQNRYEAPTCSISQNFYERLSRYTNLVDLKFKGNVIDLFQLLDGIKHLCNLTSISLTLNKSIQIKETNTGSMASTERGKRSSRMTVINSNFFHKLVSAFPALKVLELDSYAGMDVNLSAEMFMPIGHLKHLEKLSLKDLMLIDLTILKDVLSKCQCLTLIKMVNVGIGWPCNYFKFSRCIKDLPKLHDLILSHERLSYSPLYEDILACNNLRRLHIESKIEFSQMKIIPILEQLSQSCRQLLLCIVSSSHVSNNAHKSVTQLQKVAKKSGKRLIISCASKCCSHKPLARHYISQSVSYVAMRKPYEFM